VVCGDSKGEIAFGAKGLEPNDPRFYVRRCPRCGLGWTEPKVPDSEIGRWYPPAYYGKDNIRFNFVFEQLVRLFRKRRAQVIANRIPKGAVLDVGCGRGLTLGYLKPMGYEPHGVELTEEGAWHARHRLDIDVHVGNFMQAPFKPEQFNAVIFWHSLEHMSNPIEALRHAKKFLKHGGLLVVAVPNSDSFQAKLFGPYWFHLDIPRHYFHFSAASLKAALRDLGFKIVEIDHFSLEQNPYGWLQSFYNAFGIKFNFLYAFLKNRTSRIIPIKKHPLQAVVSVILLPLLLPVSLALMLLETLLRKGGTVELYAVKA